MSIGLSIVGSSRRNGEREANDFYPTPEYVTRALLQREKFNGVIWEPACGDGAISKVLGETNPVISTDLVNRGFGEGKQDFLLTNKQVNNIVTNPPFNLALEFVLHSKKCASHKIAMFLKTVFLESERRYEMFQDTSFPLKTVYQFSKRVTLYKSGAEMKNGGMQAYAWFVWDKDFVGLPTIQWIK